MIIKKPITESIKFDPKGFAKDLIIELHSVGKTKVNKNSELSMTFEVFVTDKNETFLTPFDEFLESI